MLLPLIQTPKWSALPISRQCTSCTAAGGQATCPRCWRPGHGSCRRPGPEVLGGGLLAEADHAWFPHDRGWPAHRSCESVDTPTSFDSGRSIQVHSEVSELRTLPQGTLESPQTSLYNPMQALYNLAALLRNPRKRL